MVWVGEDDPDWIEKHVHAYINIAGPVLGVAKSMTSLLSGAPTPHLPSDRSFSSFTIGCDMPGLYDLLEGPVRRLKQMRTW